MSRIVSLIVVIVLLCGCATTQKGAGVGAVAGGALGAIIGHQSGHGLEGAGIGAATGAIAGALIADKEQMKFCPECGKRFSASTTYCPYDGNELSLLKEGSN